MESKAFEKWEDDADACNKHPMARAIHDYAHALSYKEKDEILNNFDEDLSRLLLKAFQAGGAALVEEAEANQIELLGVSAGTIRIDQLKKLAGIK